MCLSIYKEFKRVTVEYLNIPTQNLLLNTGLKVLNSLYQFIFKLFSRFYFATQLFSKNFKETNKIASK